jgi:hypothetical protein
MKLVRRFLVAAISIVALAAVSTANAQQKPATAAASPKGAEPEKAAKGAPAEINITVTARPMRPSAVVDLGKILPDIELSKLRQDFYKQIEGLLLSEPF